MTIKLDLQKTYDNLDWGLLESILVDFGFPHSFIDLFLFLVQGSSITILWNGGKLVPILPSLGLSQGDPFAIYLFNLVIERLSWEIQKEVMSKQWKSICLS